MKRLRRRSAPSRRTSAYQEAAKFPYVFYGQLAAEKIIVNAPDATLLKFDPIAPPTEGDRVAFAKRPIVRAAILLAETGRLASFERFSNVIDDQLNSAQEHQMLFDIAQRLSGDAGSRARR